VTIGDSVIKGLKLHGTPPLLLKQWKNLEARTWVIETTIEPVYLYLGFVCLVLVFSLRLWLRKPTRRTFLLTILCGWGVCGVPGLVLLAILNWKGLAIGDGVAFSPGSGDTIILQSGKSIELKKGERIRLLRSGNILLERPSEEVILLQ
jgi:hypothetical protein